MCVFFHPSGALTGVEVHVATVNGALVYVWAIGGGDLCDFTFLTKKRDLRFGFHTVSRWATLEGAVCGGGGFPPHLGGVLTNVSYSSFAQCCILGNAGVF